VNSANFTVPAGKPGRADISITTPNGISTLSQAFFYVQSVQDYPSPDTFTAVLYDRARQQLYLSAGDHIDVFSLGSNQFVSPLVPPSQGTSKQFVGLAMAPDDSLLLATDLLDGSLAVINPDNPSGSYVIPITPAIGSGNPGCTIGPLYVGAVINGEAYVATGGLPGIACGPGGSVFLVNLNSRTSASANLPQVCKSEPSTSVATTLDGSKVFMGSCIYEVQSQAYYYDAAIQGPGASATLSGDGNVSASYWTFADGTGNALGLMARPDIFYAYDSFSPGPSANLLNQLQQPELNDSGSLYFLAYPDLIDIVDVEHGTLRMRLSLNETISNTAIPFSIDSGGQYIYAVTNKGLTIVNLGQALLSIGSLKPAAASVGTHVLVRGSGFTLSTTATIGGQSAAVNFTDENTLTITIPNVPPGPTDIVLTNSDGTAYTLGNGVQIQ
jgi:hypothetical protein